MPLSQFGHVIELNTVAAYLMSLDEFDLFSTYLAISVSITN